MARSGRKRKAGKARPPALKKRTLVDGVEFECIDPESISKRDLAAVLMNRDNVKKACAAAASNVNATRGFGAAYFMGMAGTPVTKIGYSTNPKKRIKQIQTGLWGDVICYGLIWAPENVAGLIEQSALKLAKSEGLRLRGEWVDLPPDEAVGLALTAMDGLEAFCDSGTFVEKWLPPRIAFHREGGAHDIALRRQESLDETAKHWAREIDND